MAADHLFGAVAVQYWRFLIPDLEAFMAKLDLIWRWAYRRFQLNSEIPPDQKQRWRAWALQVRASEAAQPKDAKPGAGPPLDPSHAPTTASQNEGNTAGPSSDSGVNGDTETFDPFAEDGLAPIFETNG
jgi:hypothetical protein